ncbi:hypothetical protein [Actinobaculum sp. 352]|uniref:hypothetical protein n=1 Tax=Actinobaculum sp. 352 TaxID=2490946 RepID=UPI000F7E49FA|nr:hypothetical protein [Actinobaculum sp. 352]RTE49357.1 hypothetical protein EKN07_07255 [Actinobaculum sp. 352]
MSRFQTRTRYVEAIQHKSVPETTAWLDTSEADEEIEYAVLEAAILIKTHGKHKAILPGDWLVLDENCTLRLYTETAFADIYEPTEDDEYTDRDLAAKLAEATDAMRNLWAQSNALMTEIENLATDTVALGEALISLQSVIATTPPAWEKNK